MKTKVGAPAVIIAVVCLAAFMGWYGYRSFTEGDKPNTTLNSQINDMLTADAKKCQGDFSKLPPDEQQKVNKATGGWGAAAIARMYRQP